MLKSSRPILYLKLEAPSVGLEIFNEHGKRLFVMVEPRRETVLDMKMRIIQSSSSEEKYKGWGFKTGKMTNVSFFYSIIFSSHENRL